MSKRLSLAVLGLLASLMAALAQAPPNLPSNTVWGNLSPVTGPSRAVSLAQLQAALAGGERTIADTNYTVGSTTGDSNIRVFAYTTLTAARTITFLSASSYAPGTRIYLLDRSGSASGTNAISTAPNGADTINGSNTTQQVIAAANTIVMFETDGVSKWTIGTSLAWSNITGTPTTLAGYGITDARKQLTASQSYYVNGNSGSTATCGPAGASTCAAGSDSADCLTPTTACLTLTHAYTLAAQRDMAQVWTASIYLAHNAGTTNYNLVCANGPLVGAAVIFVIGDSAAPTATVVKAPNGGYSLQIKDLCTIEYDYIKFADSAGNNGLGHILMGGTGNAGHLDINGITLGTLASGVQMTVGSLSSFSLTGNISIDGGAAQGINVSGGGAQANFGSSVVTITGTPAYSTAFIVIGDAGDVIATPSTFSGSATGPRCIISGPPPIGGIQGNNPNKIFPGNSDCVVDTYAGAIGLQTGSGGTSSFSFGSSGQCLTSGGSSGVLNTWANCSGSGVPQNNLNTQTANYTIATSDCGKTIQAGTGSTGLFTVTLPAVAGFASNCVLAVYNGDTLRGKILSGFPIPVATSPNNILWAGDTIQVGIVNGAWAFLSENARHRIVASTTLFVDNTNGADTNDCLAATVGACKTIQKAFDYLNTWDGNSQAVTVSVATGTSYTAGLSLNGPFHGNPTVTLTGDTGTPSNVTISTTSADGIALSNGAILTVGGFKISTATSGNGLNVSNASFLNVTGLMEYGAVANAQIKSAAASTITISANHTASGGAQFHWNATQGGIILESGSRTITLSGTPAYSAAFLNAGTGAVISFGATTFSGSATGPNFTVATNAIVNNGSTTIPGNALTSSTIATHGYVATPGSPSVSSCGTSPGSASGTDFAGKVTEGTTATGCTITFATGSTMNSCTVSLSSGTAIGITTLGSTLVVTHASVSNNVLYWTCQN